MEGGEPEEGDLLNTGGLEIVRVRGVGDIVAGDRHMGQEVEKPHSQRRMQLCTVIRQKGRGEHQGQCVAWLDSECRCLPEVVTPVWDSACCLDVERSSHSAELCVAAFCPGK